MGNDIGGISDKDMRNSLMQVSEIAGNSGEILATAGVMSAFVPGVGEIAMPILEGAAMGSEAIGYGAQWVADKFYGDTSSKPKNKPRNSTAVKPPPVRITPVNYSTSGNSQIKPYETNRPPKPVRENPFKAYQ